MFMSFVFNENVRINVPIIDPSAFNELIIPIVCERLFNETRSVINPR